MSKDLKDVAGESTSIQVTDIASVARESVQRALACRSRAIELSPDEIEHIGGAMLVIRTRPEPLPHPHPPCPPITIGFAPIPIPGVPLEPVSQ
jgi:hypothetical protein